MSVNKVQLIGNIGKMEDVRFTPNGKAVINISLATEDGFGDRKATEWHRVTIWGKPAEALGGHAKVGDCIYVEGKNKTRDYEKEGIKRYVTEVHSFEWKFVGNKKQSDSSQGQPAQQQSQQESSFDNGDIPDW